MDLRTLRPEDLKTLGPDAIAEVAARMLAQLAAQTDQIAANTRQINQQQALIERRDAELKFKEAKLERVTFELARLKAWKFAARSERMNAARRQMFEDTASEDEADLQAQLHALQGDDTEPQPEAKAKRQPRRQKLPEQLRRIEHHHEPADTVVVKSFRTRRSAEFDVARLRQSTVSGCRASYSAGAQ